MAGNRRRGRPTQCLSDNDDDDNNDDDVDDDKDNNDGAGCDITSVLLIVKILVGLSFVGIVTHCVR